MPRAVMSRQLCRVGLSGVLACGLLAGSISACGVSGSLPAEPPGATGPSGAAAAPSETPGPAPAPQPATEGPCPYLDPQVVESINGQRVDTVRISADQPYPACFFLRGDGGVQVRTWVVTATPEVARATVDAAVPVATSDLAELPGGWSGGSQPAAGGSVFAVARQGTAVVITTNQPRTLSARRITERVIAALSL